MPYDREWARNQSALLITDDNGLVRVLTAQFDKRGLHLTVARSLEQARREIEIGAFVLAVVDLAAFGTPGLRLIEGMRRHPTGRTIPIIVITSPDANDMIAAGLVAGADNYLTQPIRAKVLDACVDVLLRQTAVEMRLKRQEMLISELSIVEAAIQSKTKEQVALTTQELAAVTSHPSDPASATFDWPSFASGAFFLSDTEEQASRDWELFRAIEAGLSKCIERQKPLAVLMLETRVQDTTTEDEVEDLPGAVAERVHSVLIGRQTVNQLKDDTYCVVLPETAEAEAIWMAQRILSAVESEGLTLRGRTRRVGLRIGIALLDPNHAGSPFDILDWAQHALDRAKAGSRGGWWVFHQELISHDK